MKCLKKSLAVRNERNSSRSLSSQELPVSVASLSKLVGLLAGGVSMKNVFSRCEGRDVCRVNDGFYWLRTCIQALRHRSSPKHAPTSGAKSLDLRTTQCPTGFDIISGPQ